MRLVLLKPPFSLRCLCYCQTETVISNQILDFCPDAALRSKKRKRKRSNPPKKKQQPTIHTHIHTQIFLIFRMVDSNMKRQVLPLHQTHQSQCTSPRIQWLWSSPTRGPMTWPALGGTIPPSSLVPPPTQSSAQRRWYSWSLQAAEIHRKQRQLQQCTTTLILSRRIYCQLSFPPWHQLHLDWP